MLKSYTIVLLFLVVFFPLAKLSYAQSGDYYIGTSEGPDLENTRSNAYNNLVQQIQVFISSSMIRNLQESNQTINDNTTINTVARSSVMLTDVQEKVENLPDGSYRVTKYVRRDMVSKMFLQRRDKIISHLKLAEGELLNSRESGKVNINIVIKNYYYAYLLASVYPDTISYNFIKDESLPLHHSKNLSACVPVLIENIINNISFKPLKKIKDENLVWKFASYYKDKLIECMDYNYFDGVGQTYGAVKNGETIMTFYFRDKEAEKNAAINIEYKFEDEMDELLTLSEKADNLSMNNMIVLSLPGEISGEGAAVTEKKEAPGIQSSEPSSQMSSQKEHSGFRSDVINQLLACTNGFEEFLKLLNQLQKANKIIAGSENDFESTDGLYCAVVDKDGLTALLKREKDDFYEAAANRKMEIKQFSGKKIIWIEILK